ncbi:MAG TPA: ricin-type beta-trefoil lectin domain protein [Anaeromyxobacter sp.]|nr:ricin-type beta-trefoil lectin domain protein [Anaeromyxobacter sp.]
MLTQQSSRCLFPTIAALAALSLVACEPGPETSGDAAPAGELAAAVAYTFHVSPTGHDANPGTLAAPFRTITRARDAVRTVNASMTGDIQVYLRGGTYELQAPIAFGPQDSGNNGFRIFYQAYPGETPVLSGSVKVTGWTPYSGAVYRASLNRSTKLRYLYVNDQRAAMTSKQVTARGGYGTYSVTAGQAPWAWVSGSKSDGIQYSTSDLPAIASNRDDLEVVTASTWNENIACARDVITSGTNRVMLLQQPSGAIAQLPGWGAALVLSGSNTLYNAFEFLNGPGQFYFDKTNRWLYYWPRAGENMATADVQAPVAEQLITITGTSRTNRVKNLTFQGITFANTDYNLVPVGNSRGKATVQAASAFIAFGDGNQHNSKYQIMDTLPGAITVNGADGIQLLGNVVKHIGNEGISLINDVVNSSVVGNAILDIAGSGITVGHPQHVYLGDGGTREKYAPGVEGICTNNTISNNLIYDASAAPGFGGHAAITAYFVDSLRITNNHIQNTAYNGISLGWGWRNFKDSTTCRNNVVNSNRLINTMSRLHDSGAIYTIGQMPTTHIDQNYVRGIPAAVGGPRYGLHNDEGSAYIIENDSVLDINPGVTYTINAEDFGEKHDLTILRTYATVNKMGVTPPNSRVDPPIVVADAVWPVAQYNTALSSGIQDAYRSIIPASVLSVQDHVFPASAAVNAGTTVNLRSSGDASGSVWFAPAGTTSFVEGPTMTRAAGTATTILAPARSGTYKLFVLNAQGARMGESAALLRVSGSVTSGPISINAGGAASGAFVGDAYFSGGSTYSTASSIDTSQISGTPPPQAVLQTERYGEFTYTIPGLTPGSPYTVTLYFSESYWTAAGQRTFDVAVNGAAVLAGFDIFSAAGGANRAIARTFSTTANASGQVVTAFTRGGGPDNPKVCGIAVAASGGGTVSTGRLLGVQSGRCLDVPNLSQTNGTKLTIWDCNGGVNQQWTQTSSNTFQVFGSKCLELPGGATAAGTQVQIGDCTGGTHQQWRFNADGTITSVSTGLCLDVTGQGTANGTAVVAWTCNGGQNQRWSR